MTAIEFPARLADGDLVVRPIEERDAEAYGRAFRDDPDLGRLIGLPEDPDEQWIREAPGRSRDAAKEGRAIELAITAAGTGQLLGSLLLHHFAWQHRRCELGYWLVPSARGRGIATAAVSLVLGWLFGELGLLRVETATTTENVASQALARRVGFIEEALQRRRDVERGRRVDVIRYGLLDDDWVTARS
jgi:[ribosomal protein S5]-alanine N-acetyltransferase